MKTKNSLLICLILGVALVSFARPNNKIAVKKMIKNNFTLVPEGKVLVDDRYFKIDEFYISKTEVSNSEYQKFIEEVKATGNKELLSIIQIDSLQWKTSCNNSPLVSLYHTKPVYSEHPVVNISYEAAIAYCNWLSEKANKESDEYKYEFRLPSREEWVRAAEGKLHMVTYSWGGSDIVNKKGCSLCQYNKTTEPKTLFDNNSYTCSATDYFPNSIGLYNMNGNAAEMTSVKGIAAGGSWASKESDVMNESIMSYDAPSPMVGFRPVLVVKGRK